jgi:hypothetical protein
LRYGCEFQSFVENEHGIVANVRSASGTERIAAQYVVDCTGVRGTLRRALGIGMEGRTSLDYNLSIFFKMPELWSYHPMGKAALHFFVDANGINRNLIQLDGCELWRLGVCDEALYNNPDKADVEALVTAAIGRSIPFELLGVTPWTAHELVATSYGTQRAFLAGDSAHLNPPAGGFGLNTGVGDAVDLGWKLAATLAGWGGPKLLASYEHERRPVAQRNVHQAAENHVRSAQMKIGPAIADDSPDGALARRELGDLIRETQGRTFISDGTALGYIYSGSPVICYDGSPLPEDTIMTYVPTSRPGARAPHAWLGNGKSIIDLFGERFVLLRFGDDAPVPAAFGSAFADRGVPLDIAAVDDPDIAHLYERKLVLVRPDGHVAWRGDTLPADAAAVADVVRGAA